jgi:hypothetical protein
MKIYKKRTLFYEITFTIGMILIFAQIPIIYKTLVDFITPPLIILSVGVLAYFVAYKNFSNLQQTY